MPPAAGWLRALGRRWGCCRRRCAEKQLLRRQGTAAPGLLRKQTLSSAGRRCSRRALIHPNRLSVQCRLNRLCTARGNLQFAISTRVLRSMIKMSCFLSSHNCLPKTAAPPAFSGLPLTLGADLVVTLPAASHNNSIPSHSAQYNKLSFICWLPNRRAKSPQETQEQHVTFPPWEDDYRIYCTIHMKAFILLKITIQLLLITRKT